MTKQNIIKTAWGSKQVEVDGLEQLSQNKEISLRQSWKTPQNFWRAINNEFVFDIDVAASDENTLCDICINAKQDALSERVVWVDYRENVLAAYCNPGFGHMLPWILKASAETRREDQVTVCVLGLCAPSTAWWQTAVELASEIRLLVPRVQFQSPDPRIIQSSNSRDCALFVFRGGKLEDRLAKITTWRWK